VTARSGVELTTLRLKAIDSTVVDEMSVDELSWNQENWVIKHIVVCSGSNTD